MNMKQDGHNCVYYGATFCRRVLYVVVVFSCASLGAAKPLAIFQTTHHIGGGEAGTNTITLRCKVHTAR